MGERSGYRARSARALRLALRYRWLCRVVLRLHRTYERHMTVDDNRALALRFFEVLDRGNIRLLEDIFTEDCVFHRGDLIEPARGLAGITSIVDKRVQLYR